MLPPKIVTLEDLQRQQLPLRAADLAPLLGTLKTQHYIISVLITLLVEKKILTPEELQKHQIMAQPIKMPDPITNNTTPPPVESE